MKPILTLLLTAVLALTLAGCETLNPKVDFPTEMSTRPAPVMPVQSVPTGSLYNTASYRPLFEDRRARLPGDTITVLINEKLSATQSNATAASRSDSASVAIPLIQSFFGPGNDLNAISGAANSNKKFDSKGQSTANNAFTGTLTATVIEVLPNGNMVIAGEKQLGTNREVEHLRIYGVVNPATIMVGNTVNSTQVADARLEYRGRGAIDSAQVMGWLSRFFFTVMPF